MNGAFYLAWRYLTFNRTKAFLLAGAIALVAFVPWALQIIVDRASEELLARAEHTPLVLGSRKSALELTLSTLYFRTAKGDQFQFGELGSIDTSGLGTAIPIHCKFSAREFPVVGTSLDYFPFRRLKLEEGRNFSLLGECIVGSQVAQRLNLKPGAPLVTTPENAFDIAGEYPLKMKVAGVLAPSWSPDDNAVFVDIKTAWIIEGLGHGHQELNPASNPNDVLASDGTNIVASASVFQYQEITPKNMASFHFHGDNSNFPLTSAIVVPNDAKAGTILQGRYLDTDATAQLVDPMKVIDGLMQTVFAVRAFVVVLILLVSIATCVTTVFVVMLSLRLRKGEFQTMARIGASRRFILALPAIEVTIVIVVAILAAGVLAWSAGHYATDLGRALISSST